MSRPNLAWQTDFHLTLDELEWLGEGDFCRCYCLNQTHVLRIAKHREAAQALDREIKLLPELTRLLSVAIPTLQGWGIERHSNQRFVCYPMLAGTPLEPSIVENLAEDARLRLTRQIAQFFQELHALPLEIGVAAKLPIRSFHDQWPSLLEQAKQALQSLGLPIWRYYEHLVAEYNATSGIISMAILHGDLSPEHCLGDPQRGELQSVIDFGDSCLGDPLWDLIYVLEDYGSAFLKQVLAFYAPETAVQAARRIQIYQELNNLDYYLSQQTTGDQEAIEEATQVLINQAR